VVILDGVDLDLDLIAPAQVIVVGCRVPGSEVLELGPLDARSAVELFAVRAAAVQHRFDLDAHRRDVAQLVDVLGHALRAIEDAAARIRVMSPRVQVGRLGQVERERTRREVTPVAAVSVPLTARALAVTDVVDSTKLSEALGDARMAALCWRGRRWSGQRGSGCGRSWWRPRGRLWLRRRAG
jgi:hypothetical protein